MAGVDLAYDSDGLRSGGREALGAGQVASGAAGTLRGATCPASALGVVAGAEALAAALARTRDAHVALAEGVHAGHVDLDGRAGRVPRGGRQAQRLVALRADGLQDRLRPAFRRAHPGRGVPAALRPGRRPVRSGAVRAPAAGRAGAGPGGGGARVHRPLSRPPSRPLNPSRPPHV